MKFFKKAFVVTFSCLFFVIGCAEEKNQSVRYESLSEFRDLEGVIMISDNIVIGTVTDEEQFSESTYKYTFTVSDELKGNVEAESIDVYEFYGVMEKGKEYLLFLGSWESELYPRPVYTSNNKDSLIKVNRNNLIGGEQLVGKKKKDELIEYIKNSKEVNVFSEKEDAVIEKAKDLAELISLSDQIIHLVPKEIIAENMYVKVVSVEVIKTFKGGIGNPVLNLPADIVLENEYIVFLRGDKSLRLATREGSVVSKDDEELWNDVLKEFSE